ncbi:hypothetical protein ZOSMA_23G00630 [Zostera marina]|uniref:RING-type E3 ubiquitin transferase n=1 Tax=Zostera marina TaxID=29655 RepID=A0A0K9PH65_ZOSMR|nr:hypothetical protein ZOSMA_23G00630 [Zostera marina]
MDALCCCSCLEEFDEHAHSANIVYRNCMYLRYFFHQLFTGFETPFQRIDGRGTTSSVQEETHLTTANAGTIASGLVLRREKSLNHLQEKMQVLRRNGSSSAIEQLGYGSKQNTADSEGGHKTSYPETEKTLTMKSSFGLNYTGTASDEEDVCPTCLEEYTAENPKIVAQCSHHFHLGCIYEWMERSDYCPICGKEMEFCESP